MVQRAPEPTLEPISVVTRVASQAVASQRLWALDWGLPWKFDDIEVTLGTFDDVGPFIRENYHSNFGDQNEEKRFLPETMTAAKRRFIEDADIFLFRSEGRIVGVFISNPSDWSTYYVRWSAILPEYRRRGLFSRIVEQLEGPLASVGVERIEMEFCPANIVLSRTMVTLGYLAVGTASSERWGLTVRFAKFLRAEARHIFLRQHCIVPRILGQKP